MRREQMNIAQPAISESAATPDRTLLYIDDDPANTSMMGLIVARRPETKLLTANAGIPGIAMAQKHRPSLVLLDFNLPDMNGDQVLARLLGDPRTAGIPVVMLSGDAMPVQAERMLALGARRYITKPFNVRALLDSVEGILSEVACG